MTRDGSLQTRCSRPPHSSGPLQPSNKRRNFAEVTRGWERPFFILLGVAGHFCKISLHPLFGVQPEKLGAKSQTSRLDSFASCNSRNTRSIAIVAQPLWAAQGSSAGQQVGSSPSAANASGFNLKDSPLAMGSSAEVPKHCIKQLPALVFGLCFHSCLPQKQLSG